MAWEATALDLLEAAGIRTSWHRLTQVGNRSVLILRRFDRTRAGGRIGCISAMTAIGSSDGEQEGLGRPDRGRPRPLELSRTGPLRALRPNRREPRLEALTRAARGAV